MKRVTILALALSLGVANSAAQSIDGRYRVKGTNFNGSAYEGEAQIAWATETTCKIKWMTGSSESIGICMRNGDSFAAAYRLGNAMGLIIYKVMPDGSMQGVWTIAGENGNGTEVLTPVR